MELKSVPRKPSDDGINITRAVLYFFGIALIIAAVLLLLKGAGVLSAVPGFVIGAGILIAIGFAILSAL